jgi:hypothetical protein
VRELDTVAKSLAGVGLPFGFCGGCGLELFVAMHGGSLARSHADIDIAVSRGDIERWVRHLGGTVRVVRDGALHDMSPDAIASSGSHEVHIDVDGRALELLLGDVEAGDWLYRRDHRVRRSMSQAFLMAAAPILAPELILLFKAKEPRNKDTSDFATTHPLLGDERRSWLRAALDIAHPNHPWSRQLV